MKDIIISESIIRKALRQSINEMMDEDRTELPNGVVEVDNFENLRELMKWEKPGDTVYFVQIAKRDKDNPGQHSRHNAAEYLENYFITDMAQFNSLEQEIKNTSEKEVARAMIFLNPRSKAVIDKYTSNYLRKVRGDKKIAAAIAAGRSFEDVTEGPTRSICFVDIDSDDQNIINKAMRIIQNAGIKPLFAYRTLNNGIHIILPDVKEAKKLDFSPINGNMAGLGRRARMNAIVSLEIDKATLLYAKLVPQGYTKQQAYFNSQKAAVKNNNRKRP